MCHPNKLSMQFEIGNDDSSFFFNMQEKQVDHLSKLKAKVSTPEGVPRLFDLIKVQDDRMKLAFFAALGNTVVAKDLEQVGSSTLLCVMYF